MNVSLYEEKLWDAKEENVNIAKLAVGAIVNAIMHLANKSYYFLGKYSGCENYVL